jgi:hypothetical protein
MLSRNGRHKTLSIAKAIAMLANNKGFISDYLENNRLQEFPSLPYIEIPTTREILLCLRISMAC